MVEESNTRSLYRVAVVASRFNHDITARLMAGAEQQLLQEGLLSHGITTEWVPGAVELPLVAQVLARSQRFDAIICVGAVIRGDTDHYQFVCDQVSQGCQHVALAESIPVIFCVLTTETEAQAFARAGGALGNKGAEAALAAIEMIDLLARLRQ